MRNRKERLAKHIYFILPIVYLLPVHLRLFGIGVNWFEIILWGTILLGVKRNLNLTIWLLLIGYVTLLSAIYGMSRIGYGFNLRNLMFIKFLPTYIGAVILGSYIPKTFKNNTMGLVCISILLIMTLLSTFYPDIRIIFGEWYGIKTISSNWRLSFFSNNPIGFTVLSTIFFILASRDRSSTIQFFLYMICLIPIFISGSRAGIFILSTYAFFLFLTKTRTIKITLIFLSFLFVINISMLNIQNPIYTVRSARMSSGSLLYGIEQRIEIFKEMLSDFKISPILGTGYRQGYQLMAGRRISFDYGSHKLQHSAHNQYIAFIVNHGIIGFIIFIGFLAFIGRRILIFYRRTRLRLDKIFNSANLLFYVGIFMTYLLSMFGWESLYNLTFTSFFMVQFGRLVAESSLFYRGKTFSVDMNERNK